MVVQKLESKVLLYYEHTEGNWSENGESTEMWKGER
jgi:hypothetical protein